MKTEGKPFILVLCTGNSCRSHKAEGFLRAALGGFATVQSAGCLKPIPTACGIPKPF